MRLTPLENFKTGGYRNKDMEIKIIMEEAKSRISEII